MSQDGTPQGVDFDAANRDFADDDQAGAEIFDETHLDDEGDGEFLLDEADANGEVASAPDEVELVYAGLRRNQRGAQASAAHWESKRLSDDDIEDLGYGPDTEEQPA